MRKFLSLILMSGLTGALAQGTLYTNATTPLLNTATGTAIGKLLPGTPVQIVATSSKMTQVSFQGWSTQKGPKTVYTGVGVRMGVASLTDTSTTTRKVLKTSTDPYKAVWEQVQVTGWVDSSKLSKDVSTVWAQAKTLYTTQCSTCHAAHDPTDHTANEWVGVFKGMLPRTSMTPEQGDLVLQYLQNNAKK